MRCHHRARSHSWAETATGELCGSLVPHLPGVSEDVRRPLHFPEHPVHPRATREPGDSALANVPQRILTEVTANDLVLADILLGALFLLAISGIPFWMVIRRPDDRPASTDAMAGAPGACGVGMVAGMTAAQRSGGDLARRELGGPQVTAAEPAPMDVVSPAPGQRARALSQRAAGGETRVNAT